MLLLNPDAFVDEGCLGELVHFLETHPTAVAVGPRLRFGDGRLQRSCRGFPSVYRVATEYLGLRTLRRRSPLLNGFYCGGFDHDRAATRRLGDGRLPARARCARCAAPAASTRSFFLYSEEVDLLRRLADEGGETWFDPAAGAVHLWGGRAPRALRARRSASSCAATSATCTSTPGPRAARAVGCPARRAWCCARRATAGYREALRWLAARDVDALLAGA